MYIDEAQVSGEVYKSVIKRDGSTMYLVKVSFLDIEAYMSGITVQTSIQAPDKGWWVQPPRYQPKRGNKWIKPIEFSRMSPLWALIEEASILAVEAEIQKNEGLADIGEESISLDDIPDFNVEPP